METRGFSVPQRQSVIGVLLIFATTFYKIVRGFWVLGAYLILTAPTGPMLLYILLGTLALGVAILIYSYLYYRSFLFHIDYENEEFVLQKGVFSTKNLAIPFEKIQRVYFERSILQRFLNIDTVLIDTAGSDGDEVKINAISREKADLLSEILGDLKKEVSLKSGEETPEEINAPEKTRLHTLDWLTLFKIGISTNYLRGFVLVLAFFATVYNEFSPFIERHTEKIALYSDRIPDISDPFTTAFTVFILLLIISVLLTVFQVFIKYFGLKLIRTPKTLELEMGLKTNTKVQIQPRRVQLFQVITNPIQRRMNLYEARIALASSEDALRKNRIKIPGLGRDALLKVRTFLYGNPVSSFEKEFRPHSLLLYRGLGLASIPVVVSYPVLLITPYRPLYLWLALAICYLLLAAVYQFIHYHALQLKFTDEFLYKKQGVWSKKEESFENYKMQAFTVTQPFWYRRRNLVNVKFHTAGGDMLFRAVTKDIFSCLNYLLYKIESTEKGWM